MGIGRVEMILSFLCVSTGKQRSDRPEPSPFYVHRTASICKQLQILQTKHIYKKKKEDDHLILRGRGGGGVAVYVESEYLFPIFIYFHPTSAKTIYFKI